MPPEHFSNIQGQRTIDVNRKRRDLLRIDQFVNDQNELLRPADRKRRDYQVAAVFVSAVYHRGEPVRHGPDRLMQPVSISAFDDQVIGGRRRFRVANDG